jgi:hypothetical protein
VHFVGFIIRIYHDARSFECQTPDFKSVNNFKKHWICLYFKCHFLIYPRFGNKFKTHHIRYVINWKNSNWSCSIVLFILVTVCSASAVTAPRTDYVSIKPCHWETVSSVWVGLHIKCYFRPTQVRKIWTMMAKIPIMTYQENRSGQRRSQSLLAIASRCASK